MKKCYCIGIVLTIIDNDSLLTLVTMRLDCRGKVYLLNKIIYVVSLHDFNSLSTGASIND